MEFENKNRISPDSSTENSAGDKSGESSHICSGEDVRTKKGLAGFICAYWHVFALFFIILIFTVNNAWFIANDKSPIVADMAEHLPYARRIYQTLFETSGVKDILFYRNSYEPLIHYNTAVMMRIFGVSIPVALWSLFPFSVIMILSIYGAGKHFGGKTGGIAAALIGTANCYFLDYSRLYMQDIAHAALTCLAFYLILRSDAFKHKIWSWLFGLVFGLSLLARFGSLFYLIAPIVILFIFISFRSIRVLVPAIASMTAVVLMEKYFFTTGVMLAKTHTDPVPYIFLQLKVLLMVCCLLILLIVLLSIFRKKIFGEKGWENSIRFTNALGALTLALIVSQPWYVLSSGMLFERFFWHTGGHPLSDPDFMMLNLTTNYHTINNFFPLIFFLAVVGLIFAVVKRIKLLDMSMLVFMGIVGFFLSSVTASPFSRYFLVDIMVLAVLGGYWVSYAGVLKLPAMAYMASYFVLMLFYPFFSPHVPGFWEVYEVKRNKIVYFEPVYAANPTPDNFKLYAISDDIGGALSKLGDNRDYCLLLQLSPDFASLEKYPGRNAGMMSERSLMDLYGRNLIRVLWFRGLPFSEDGIMENINAGDYLNTKKDKPVVLVAGYENPGFPAELTGKIEKEYGRKVERISAYGVFDNKKVNVYLIYPEGER